MTMILQMTKHQMTCLENVAKKNEPIEACAILYGKIQREIATLTKIEVTPNLLQSTTRFEIDPGEVIEALNRSNHDGERFLGIFHSHPTPAKPSKTDLKYMKLWPKMIWLIYSTSENNITAYQLKNDKVQRIEINVD